MGRTTRGRALRGLVPVLVALAALAQLAGCNAGGETRRARNLVLVSLDTLRADRLGLYGYERNTSPNLDAWAREAFVFENATSASNATVTAHHALFQSQTPLRAADPKRNAPTLASILRARGFRTAAFTDGGTMSRELGFSRGFERFDEHYQGLAQSLPPALEWLDEVAAEGAPFYLFVHSFDVHLPYDPPPPYDARFAAAGYRGVVNGPRTLPLLRGVRRIFGQNDRAEPLELSAADRAQVSALYDGEIAKTDTLLTRLLARLDADDLADETLVVILSDHGEEFWEHGSVLHAHTLYQEMLHVPLLLRVPGWRDAARRVDARVSLLDVLPTLLELLDVPVPHGVRGRSLVPLLRGEPQPDAPILAEARAFGQDLQAVIDGRFKLVRHLADGRTELYDLVADPGETRDLSDAQPALRARLLRLLDRQLSAAPDVPDPLASPERLDDDTQRRLRELGYIE